MSSRQVEDMRMLLLGERHFLLRHLGVIRHVYRCSYDHNPVVDIGMRLAL